MPSPANETTNLLRDEMKKSVKLLRRLRDEIRVDLHLGGMEARDRWSTLEAHFEKAEMSGRRASKESLKSVREVVEAFRTFRDSLRAKRYKHEA